MLDTLETKHRPHSSIIPSFFLIFLVFFVSACGNTNEPPPSANSAGSEVADQEEQSPDLIAEQPPSPDPTPDQTPNPGIINPILVPTPVLTPKPVALYHFDGDTLDASGNANHGVLKGNTAFVSDNCPSGSCLKLDGSGDWVEVVNSASLDIKNNQITLMAWVKVDQDLGDDLGIVLKNDGSTYNYTLIIDNREIPSFRTVTDTNGLGRMDVTTAAMQISQWHHVVGTYDGQVMRVYLDAVLVSERTQSGNLISTTEPLLIGRRALGDNRFFRGFIDEVSVWDRALTQAEIQNQFNEAVIPEQEQEPSPTPTPPPPASNVFQVGPTRTYKMPSEVSSIVPDGAVVEIDAGIYSGDATSWNANNLTIRGMGGKAHLRADGVSTRGKGTWIINGDNVTIDNIEFSGAAVPGSNGAGIRHQGGNLTIRNAYFHDNENGILTDSNATAEILIEYSEFAYNGAGDGYSHNMYIGNIQKFTFQHNYSHHAKAGHNLKSRARENFILYNKIMDASDGTSSYAIDLPNGGLSVVMGNILQQGPNTGNSSIVAYAAEGGTNPSQALYFVNNTVINDRSSGKFVQISGTPTIKIVNNLFVAGGTVPTGTGVSSNLELAYDNFVDAPNYNYHLLPTASAIDIGLDAGSVENINLTPVWEYVEGINRIARGVQGVLDLGAYEFGTETSTP